MAGGMRVKEFGNESDDYGGYKFSESDDSDDE
jgi:hypothetical protein